MNQELKKDVSAFLYERGADIFGVASTKTWAREDMVTEACRPDSLWTPTKSVIVIGLQMPLPVVETTPSVQHRDLYNACNHSLDRLAFDVSRWLNRRGFASLPLSRDGYANIHILKKKPGAAFSHIFAAYYAGLGFIGINNTILTREYGPRVRFVTVFTEAELSPDHMMKDNLCIRCGACSELCPAHALKISKTKLRNENVRVARYDKQACTEWARLLTQRGCYPCGICIKVCPVGQDRTLYGREKALSHYRKELTSLVFDASDPVHRQWNHIRSHGSLLFDETVTRKDTLQTVFKKIRNGT
jgi:epoxyqueuosine reductase